MPYYKDFEGYPGNSSIVKEIEFPAFRSAIEVSRVLKYWLFSSDKEIVTSISFFH